MYLTTTTIMPYLFDHGILSKAALLDDHWTIFPRGRRNRNFLVQRQGAAGVFIKQVSEDGVMERGTVAHEAAMYAQVPQALQDHVPDLLHYDVQRGLLVLQEIPDSASLADYIVHLPLPPAKAAPLAAVLAQLHGAPGRQWTAALGGQCRARLPWVVDLHRSAGQGFTNLSPANQQLIQMIQHDPTLRRIMEIIPGLWQVDGLTHNDLKADNVLVSHHDDGVWVVDWEMADVGDSAWDIASFIQGILLRWVLGLSGQVHVSQAVATTAWSLNEQWPALAAFWNRYRQDRTWLPVHAEHFMQRLWMYVAARLVQAVFEYAYAAQQLDAGHQHLLQLARRFAQDGEATAKDLLPMFTATGSAAATDQEPQSGVLTHA